MRFSGKKFPFIYIYKWKDNFVKRQNQSLLVNLHLSQNTQVFMLVNNFIKRFNYILFIFSIRIYFLCDINYYKVLPY